MPCIENLTTPAPRLFRKENPSLTYRESAQVKTRSIANLLVSVVAVALFSGCANRQKTEPVSAPVPLPIPVPAPAPVFTPAPPPPPAPPAPPVVSTPRIPLVSNWAEYRRRAAQMVIAANPGASFVGPQPAQWTGIATITVMLNADGSIRALDLMRGSRISPEVNDLALAAARRTANFGPVSNLPEPWQFNETFLYNDNSKFQLVTIVESR